MKESSRFCRNSVAGDMMLERVFPKMNGACGVRVIMVNDFYDSVSSDPYTSSLMIAFNSLFTDMHCRDASAKTKASLSAKRKQGELVGSFAPYGYAKGESADRGKLVVDPKLAGIVHVIFDSRIGGMSAAGIATKISAAFASFPYERFTSKGCCRSSNFCRGERSA